MTSAELYQWMADPSLLTRSTLLELRQMVDEYPYFHAVRMLYLKNLAVLEDVRLEKELKKMSVFVPDRRQLFLLINESHFAENEPPKEVSEPPVISKPDQTDVAFERIERVLNSAQPTPPAVVASDYVNWLAEHTEDLPVETGDKNQLKHQDLIDSFIENDGQFTQRIHHSVTGKANAIADAGIDEMPDPVVPEKMSLDDSFFTETLARVYIKQKRYDKALEIIRVLSLKYPEKSVYFADQIRYLEKIINIKK